VPLIVAPAVFAGVGDAAAAELVDGDVRSDESLSPHPVGRGCRNSGRSKAHQQSIGVMTAHGWRLQKASTPSSSRHKEARRAEFKRPEGARAVPMDAGHRTVERDCVRAVSWRGTYVRIKNVNFA
jgi:hypothetical protein